jgi:cytochrome b pre-mRNA-processing protein 3
MGIWPFRRSRVDEDADRLLAAVRAASRQAAMFGAGRIPDTLQGRFEAVALHASLALFRLRVDEGASDLAQTFTDKLFREFDAGLREEGVGDTSVSKRMHKLAGDFYGRVQAYSAAIESGDRVALAAAFERNIGLAPTFAGPLVAHAFAAAERQASEPFSSMFEIAAWPQFAE